MRFLKKFSKWLHKYLGLVLLLFLGWMSISGVLLNHPELIAWADVPKPLVPPQYHIENWQRGALKEVVFPETQPGTCYAYGGTGIWRSTDSGATFHSWMGGDFPGNLYERKTNSLLLMQYGGETWLVAGTHGGVFVQGPRTGWKKVSSLPADERPMKLLHVGERVYLFTESHVYSSAATPNSLAFVQEHPRQAGENTVTMIKVFFDLHDGKVLGLPGKLLFDAVGIILFILSVTALYTWYYPKKLKWRKRFGIEGRRKNPRVFKFLLKYHLKLGIWSAAILFIMAGTGIFMRPPLLVAIANNNVPAGYYPGILPDNPWHDEIRNAAYEPVTQSFVIDCKDGMYVGPIEFSEPYRQIALPVPVFVMGTTVLECDDTGNMLMGSFNGLYRVNLFSNSVVDEITGAPPVMVSSLRPGQYLITGYFRTPDGVRHATSFTHGLIKDSTPTQYGDFPMPEEIRGYGMPLWNYLFELHNGRFFQDIVGMWHFLLVPVGALLTIILLITGVVDWFVVRGRKNRASAAMASRSVST